LGGRNGLLKPARAYEQHTLQTAGQRGENTPGQPRANDQEQIGKVIKGGRKSADNGKSGQFSHEKKIRVGRLRNSKKERRRGKEKGITKTGIGRSERMVMQQFKQKKNKISPSGQYTSWVNKSRFRKQSWQNRRKKNKSELLKGERQVTLRRSWTPNQKNHSGKIVGERGS